MPTSCRVLCVTTALLLFVFVESQWQSRYTPAVGVFDSTIASTSGSALASITIVNNAAQFFTTLGTTEAVYPGQCTVIGGNEYGFAKWKNRAISMRASGSRIVLTFAHTPGFALLADETVVCGLTNPDTQKPMYSLRANEELSPDTFSFEIKRSTIGPTIVFSGSSTGGVDESQVRKGGLNLALELQGGDVWLPQRRAEVLAGISSLSGGEPGVFENLLQLTVDDLVIPDDAPHRIEINFPADALADFDIGAPLVISYEPAASTTLKQDAPSETGQGLSVTITNLPRKPFVVFRDESGADVADDIFTISEDCVRGTANPAPPCGLTVTAVMQSGGTVFDDTVPDAIMRSAFSTADTVLQNVSSDIFDFIAYGQVQGSADQSQLVINLKTIPDLDVAAASTIAFVLPTQTIENREPPTRGKKPLELRIEPSPTAVVGTAEDVLQSAVWTGGVTFNLTLDGETWDQEATRAQFINATTASPGVATNEFGWETLRHQLVPATTGLSFPNPQTLTVTLQQNVDYELSSTTEVITFNVLGSMLASGKDPRSVTGNVITVTAVDPTLVVFGSREFHERDVWNGTVEFVLTLAGARWRTDDFMAKCGDKLQWVTDATQADDNGWQRTSVRAALMDDALELPPVKRSLRVKWNALTSYDVVKGETISVAIDPTSECTSDTRAKQPVGSPTIFIAPHAALVDQYFVAVEDIAATEADPSSLSSRRLPISIAQIFTAYAEANPDIGVEELPMLTESRVRNGGIAFVMDLTMDRFDTTVVLQNDTDMQRDIVRQMFGSGTEATGWYVRKGSIVDASGIVVRRDGAQMCIPLQFYAAFDVSAAERVWLSPDPSWMRAKVEPEEPMAFYVDVSPGLVNLFGWTGESSNDTVTEVQLRTGSVGFSLGLLGDSWSNDRESYAISLQRTVDGDVVDGTDGSDINTARFELVPGMEFWAFSSADGYATVQMRFQRSLQYDVSQPERVRFQLDNRTVSSPLGPSWLVRGAELPYFEFTVVPAPGELMLSGTIHAVAEQDVRRRTLTFRLQLFGEKFVTPAQNENITRLVFDGVRGDDTGPFAFNSLKSELLAEGANAITIEENVLTLTLLQNRAFRLTRADTLRIVIPPSLFRSGIIPHYTPPFAAESLSGVRSTSETTLDNTTFAETLIVPLARLQRSGGEIRAAIGANGTNLTAGADGTMTLPEAVLSSSNVAGLPVYVYLSLDGDVWNADMVNARPAEFLLGFESLTPTYDEPTGFNRLRYDILRLAEPSSVVTVVNESTVRVEWCLSCPGVPYDIAGSDAVVFAVTRPQFVETGVVPTPSSLALTVLAAPRWVAVELKPIAVQTDFWAGQLTPARFRQALAAVLTAHSSQIEVRDNAIIASRHIAFQFQQSSDADVVASDARSPATMTDVFLSINRTWITDLMGADVVYLEEDGRPQATLPPGATLAPVDAPTAQPETLSDQVSGGMWFALLVALATVAGVFFYMSDIKLKRGTAVGLLVGVTAGGSERKPIVYIGDENVNVMAGDEQAGVVLDTRRHYAGQRHMQSVQAKRRQPGGHGDDDDDEGAGRGVLIGRNANPLAHFNAAERREPLRQLIRRQVHEREGARRDQEALGRHERAMARLAADPFDVRDARGGVESTDTPVESDKR